MSKWKSRIRIHIKVKSRSQTRIKVKVGSGSVSKWSESAKCKISRSEKEKTRFKKNQIKNPSYEVPVSTLHIPTVYFLRTVTHPVSSLAYKNRNNIPFLKWLVKKSLSTSLLGIKKKRYIETEQTEVNNLMPKELWIYTVKSGNIVRFWAQNNFYLKKNMKVTSYF